MRGINDFSGSRAFCLCIIRSLASGHSEAGSGLVPLRAQNSDLASSTLYLMLTHFFCCVAMHCAPNLFDLMKEDKSMHLHSQVQALIISRRNIMEQLMPTPGEGQRSLFAMIYLAADLCCIIFTNILPLLGLCTRYGKGMSPVRCRILPLPILIEEDSAFWCQF